MSATGRGAERRELDFYETPPWATRAVLPLLGLPRRVLDLGCGGGAIRFALRTAWGKDVEICGVEIDKQRAAEAFEASTADGLQIYDDVVEADVLLSDPGRYAKGFDLVVSNPPYTHAREFVDRARGFLRAGGRIAFLLRVGFAESVERVTWHRDNPCDMHVLSRRPGFYPNNPNAKDSAAYGWFLFGPGHGGRWSVLECEPPTRARRRAVAATVR